MGRHETHVGLDAEHAKRQICAAIADRAISVRIEIDKTERDMGGRCLSDQRVKPPHRLGPEDLGWEHSKPQVAWDTGPYGPESYAFMSQGWRARRIVMLELRTDDVTRLFCLDRGNEAEAAHGPATAHIVESVPPASPLKPRSTGGRPPKYDWNSFAAELVRLANTPDESS
jgi:hypothetical protein